MKKVVIFCFILLLSVGLADASLSDGFFCKVKSEQVVISLKKTEGFYKCKDTVASLENVILQTAKDLMTVQTYINRGRDVDYRVSVKKNKLATLENLQNARKNLMENMKVFENNLVVKSVQYFVLSITPYKVNLQRSLVKIETMTGSISSQLSSYAVLLKQQVKTIESLGSVQSIDQLIPLLTNYIYLKKEISGKYE